MSTLKAPYPWFGGKSRIAPVVWERLGNCGNYIEPFFGSGAVLLSRPHQPGTETINDLNAFVSNFWRAVKADPAAVAHYADFPVSEVDLHARHKWLVNMATESLQQCKDDPEYFDAKIAGWWAWGASQWIGSGWCSPSGRGNLKAQLPDLHCEGIGLHRTRQKIPHLSDAGQGLHRSAQPDKGGLEGYITALAFRFRNTRICCGDWSRIMGPTPTTKHGLTGVFLDPPYSNEERSSVYSTETPGVAADVREWCAANGQNPLLRIAYCSYGEADVLPGWTRVQWKANGGYGNQGNGRGKANAARECVDFSPACLTPGLFGMIEQEAQARQ